MGTLHEKTCLICRLTEKDFKNNNCWSIEHIVPEAIGNKKLTIDNICKHCNDRMGKYIDYKFTETHLIKGFRYDNKLKGKSGKVPFPYHMGVDKLGRKYTLDSTFTPRIVPEITVTATGLSIRASTFEEAEQILTKKKNRGTLTEEKYIYCLDKLKNTKIKESNVELDFSIEINFKDILYELVKIALEFSFYALGDIYLKDKQYRILKDIIYNKIYLNKDFNDWNNILSHVPTGNCDYVLHHDDLGNPQYLKMHILFFFKIETKLLLSIKLFGSDAFSFVVKVSDSAYKYSDTSNFEYIIPYNQSDSSTQ